MWAIVGALAFAAAGALAVCEQGTGFDPTLKLILSASQMTAGLPAARTLLGATELSELCVSLEVAGVFRCDLSWTDGMSGYAMSDRSIVAEANARLPARADSVLFSLSNDIYFENPVGLRSPPIDPPPVCSRNLLSVRGRRRLAAAPPVYGALRGAPGSGAPAYAAPCPPPLYGAPPGFRMQEGATDTLSFMSAYSPVPRPGGPAACYPRCQDAGAFRYAGSGKNVTIYIVDQAVAEHDDLKGRLSPDRYYAQQALENKGQPCASWHGTHVAALAAGHVYGTAKEATIVSVAVQPGCSMDGRTSDLIAGLDWVLARHDRVGGPAVVSMSLIVTSSAAAFVLESSVRDLIDSGIIVVAAAGNFADDACKYMPANLDDVITVAAIQLDNVRGIEYASPWASSNVGGCVTLWAPGAFVTSASSDTPTATAVYSGTSQATPMISGLAAQFLGLTPGATHTDVRQHLQDTSVAALQRVPPATTARVAQVAL